MEYGLWAIAGFRGSNALMVADRTTAQLLRPANDNARALYTV